MGKTCPILHSSFSFVISGRFLSFFKKCSYETIKLVIFQHTVKLVTQTTAKEKKSHLTWNKNESLSTLKSGGMKKKMDSLKT